MSDDNIVNMFDYVEARRVANDNKVIEAEKEILELIKQMEFVESRCKEFWDALSSQQKMMVFYTVNNALFHSCLEDGVDSLDHFLKAYLNIDVDENPIFRIVLDGCGADVIWDMLNMGKEQSKKD